MNYVPDLVIYDQNNFKSCFAAWIIYKKFKGKPNFVGLYSVTKLKDQNVLILDWEVSFQDFFKEANSVLIFSNKADAELQAFYLGQPITLKNLTTILEATIHSKVFVIFGSLVDSVWNFCFPNQKMPEIIQDLEDGLEPRLCQAFDIIECEKFFETIGLDS